MYTPIWGNKLKYVNIQNCQMISTNWRNELKNGCFLAVWMLYGIDAPAM